MFLWSTLFVLLQCNSVRGTRQIQKRQITATPPTTCTPSSATTTINSQADAKALSTCFVIAGSVLVSTAVNGTISFDGPQNITGNLIADSADLLTGLSSSSLSNISGDIIITNLSNTFDVFNFPSLGSAGSLTLSSLPGLGSVETLQGFTTKSMTISNTSLGSAPLLSNDTEILDINNNFRIGDLAFNLASISTSLNFDSNGAATFSFPKLVWASNITAINVPQLNLPVLAVVNNSFGIYGSLEVGLNAPQLTTIGTFENAVGTGSLSVVSSPELTTLGLGSLRLIGGNLSVIGNNALRSIALTALQTVGGGMDLEGGFHSANFSSLVSVKKAMSIQTTDSSFDCSTYKALDFTVIQGGFECRTINSSMSTAPAPVVDSPSPGISPGAKAGFGIAIPLIAVLSAGATFFWLRHKKRNRMTVTVAPRLGYSIGAELPGGGKNEEKGLPVQVNELGEYYFKPVPEAHELCGGETVEEGRGGGEMRVERVQESGSSVI
ncbi:uncharacterized protein LY89DRAFT_286113 [Mollisia scopiformis]|uniref:Uncharacterized protein n=1 Tax=Mollisia scopiformis TaxID=149040 RepID=A0A132BAG5_MOLSC|nr:uncharacterized protein LY89DRAFT_286113 [Mollisia scopiformis]KUJ09392.1 hypothetical protein LY89DRAFT_286113 [Mollisia scopiformis]